MSRPAKLPWIAALAAGFIFGQPGDLPKFEVASIRPSDPHRVAPKSVSDPERFVRGRATVKSLVEWAYDIEFYQLDGGPEWSGSRSSAYDVQATTGGTADMRQIKLMVQSLLADRFQLKFHREMRQLPVYALVVANSGPKLRIAKDLEFGEKPRMALLYGTISARSAGAADLAKILAPVAGRPVFAKTGLDGAYDFEVQFDQSSAGTHPDPRPRDAGQPSIFTALQEQLGLRLEPQRAMLEILVIDNIERPSPN